MTHTFILFFLPLANRCNETNLSESELSSVEVAKADKSLFIQELILTTLSDSAPPVNLTGEPVPALLNTHLLQQNQQPEKLIQNQEKSDRDAVKAVKSDDREKVDGRTGKDGKVMIDDMENREPEVSDDCEGLDTSEDVIISPEEKEEERDDGHVAAAIKTKARHSSPPIALRSTDNLPVGGDLVTAINFESLLLNDNSTPVMSVNQQQQRSSASSTTTSTLSCASAKNRNAVPSATTAAAMPAATGVVHSLVLNTCLSASSSSGMAASSQPHVQINPASIRTSSQSTWTGPTAVRRRTVNNELHSLTRNSSNRNDVRTTGASASGPTHPLKRGLSQPQTASPAPPQET